MQPKKRLIEIIECLRNCANNTDCERCSRWLHPCDEKCVDDLMASAAEELEKFVNAVEVVHGRWKSRLHHKLNSDGILIKYCDIYYCSECGTERPMVPPYNYCPNCGADMRERKDND